MRITLEAKLSVLIILQTDSPSSQQGGRPVSGRLEQCQAHGDKQWL